MRPHFRVMLQREPQELGGKLPIERQQIRFAREHTKVGFDGRNIAPGNGSGERLAAVRNGWSAVASRAPLTLLAQHA